MKKLSMLLLCCLPLLAGAQKQNFTWYLGNGAGLDFNPGCDPVVRTNGRIDGFEGCATISNSTTGELLFYTNSDSVWNRNHTVMPGGHLVTNGSTITQVLIVQKPGNSSVYYIITSEVQATGQGLQYHVVDMNLNSGLGGLVSKNNPLYPSPVTEKITAIKHANGADIWLIGHEHGSRKFLSFLLTASGIHTTPVVSDTGKVYTSTLSVQGVGEMKASPDGRKLAVVTVDLPHVELFRFNKTTGQVGELITLLENGGYDGAGTPSGLYGISFSANSAMLYVSKINLPGANSPAKIIQYNTNLKDSASIQGSRVDVFTSTAKSLYSLQLAPNRKIYIGQNYSNYLSVINAPDSSGTTCDFGDDGLYLQGKLSGWGLNNLMEYGNYCVAPPKPTDIADPGNDPVTLQLFPNPFSDKTSLRINRPLSNARLAVYNALGQQVSLIDNIKGQALTINRGQLPAGLYCLRLIQDNQVYAQAKMVIADQ